MNINILEKLQKQFSVKQLQTFDKVKQKLKLNDPYHKQLLPVIKILQKPQRQRNKRDLGLVEQFFFQNYKYVSVLKDNLSAESYQQIFNEIKFECISNCRVIFQAGDIGRKMYFILYGEVGILLPLPYKEAQQQQEDLRYHSSHIQNKMLNNFLTFENLVQTRYQSFRLVNVLLQGDIFGEVAIQNRIPRTGTVLTKTDIFLAVLSYDTYQKYIQLTQEQINREMIAYLYQISIFKFWPLGGLYIILRNCEEISYKPFEYIYRKQDIAKYIYFIKKGEVKLTIYDKQQINQDLKLQKSVCMINAVVQLTLFQHFGDWEIYLSQNELLANFRGDVKQLIDKVIRSSTVQTLTNVTVSRMTLLQFLEIFRIFGSLQTVQQICQKQSQVRKNLNDKRLSIVNEIKLYQQAIQSSKSSEVIEFSSQMTNYYQTSNYSHQKDQSQINLIDNSQIFPDKTLKRNVSQKIMSKGYQIKQRHKTQNSIEEIPSHHQSSVLKIFDTIDLKNKTGQQKLLLINAAFNKSQKLDTNQYPDKFILSIRKPEFVLRRFSSLIRPSLKVIEHNEQDNESECLSPFKRTKTEISDKERMPSVILPCFSTWEIQSPLKFRPQKNPPPLKIKDRLKKLAQRQINFSTE